MKKLLIAPIALLAVVPLLVGTTIAIVVTGPTGLLRAGGSQSGWSQLAMQDIPDQARAAYRQGSALVVGVIPMELLAGIGKVETDHCRSQSPGVHSGSNSAGAEGCMQFLPSTWVAYHQDCGGGGNIYSLPDSACGAAALLKADLTPGGISQAVYAYNHSWSYVSEVLGWADRYRGLALVAPGPGGTTVGPVVIPVLTGPVGTIQRTDMTPIFGRTWPTAFPVGQCTYWASSNHPGVAWVGDAWQWWAKAATAGHPESSVPQIGEIVVYTNNGHYSGFGHVAIVVGVWGSSYTVSEMNLVGLDLVDQRVSPWPDPEVLGFVI